MKNGSQHTMKVPTTIAKVLVAFNSRTIDFRRLRSTRPMLITLGRGSGLKSASEVSAGSIELADFNCCSFFA